MLLLADASIKNYRIHGKYNLVSWEKITLYYSYSKLFLKIICAVVGIEILASESKERNWKKIVNLGGAALKQPKYGYYP